MARLIGKKKVSRSLEKQVLSPANSLRGNPLCQLCSLYETAQYVCLMGRGPIPCDYMFIGEAPGEREDDIGKPFQGRGGHLLDNALENCGIKRTEVYITNMVKCRPPENRKPKAAEIKACREYLLEEIGKVKPKYIVLLGATALKLINKSAVTKIHGSTFDIEGITYFISYHPAAVLYDPTKEEDFRKDIKKFSDLIRGRIVLDDLDMEVIGEGTSLNKLLEDLDKATIHSFDIETTSLDWFKPDEKINSLQISTDSGKTWVVPLGVYDNTDEKISFSTQTKMLKKIYRVLKDKPGLAQNGKFDNLWLWEKFGIMFDLQEDTKLQAHLIDENRSTSLKPQAIQRLGVSDWDIPLKEKTRGTNYEYAARDPWYTLKLHNLFNESFRKDPGMRKIYRNITMPCQRIFQEIEKVGMYIDRDQLYQTEKELKKESKEVERALNRESPKKINWNSPDQVADVLYSELGLPIINETPGGKPSTSESTILELSNKSPICQLLLRYRGIQKMLSTYVVGWQDLMVDDLVYFSTNITGTVTGRFSSRLHQVPRDKRIRSIIKAPEGWTHFVFDYSQIELRIAAFLSRDRRMRQVFQTGGDIHLETASEISGLPEKEITSEQRKMAKAINFGLIYGMWWRKLIKYAKEKYGVILTVSEAKSFRNRFFTIYNGYPTWHDKQRRIVFDIGFTCWTDISSEVSKLQFLALFSLHY